MNANRFTGGLLVLGGLLPACAAAAAPAEPSAYVREDVYDTSVYGDEALVNVSLANNRWPDCTTLESAIQDIFRLEGAQHGTDQDKALALWKWFRILVSATGGSYAYEGPRGEERLCHDPHKIFTVYGHHQCDGMSWAMAALWRAAGYMAFDECTLGHTTAALRYQDRDGEVRYHSLDPQRRYYHWDEQHQWVSTRSMPVMRGMVYRHLTAPRELHSLRTSLRLGETIERKWDNRGHVVPSGTDKLQAERGSYYAYRPGKTSGVYAAVGEEVQTFAADTSAAHFASSLYPGSRNTACHQSKPTGGLLHPAKPGEVAVFVYRLAPPYVTADARVEATLLKGDAADLCRLSLSWDGVRWQPFYTKQQPSEESIAVNIGKEARQLGRPNVYSAYNFFVKAEFQTDRDIRTVGMKGLQVVVFRMLNKRTLPNLRPGENVLKVTADKIAEGLALELKVNYRVHGRPHQESRLIRQFPYYFKIDVPDVAESVHEDYDQHFNDGPLQMSSITMGLKLAGEGRAQSPSLPQRKALAGFALSSPHPADMTHRKAAEQPETDVRQTCGFFPQSDRVLDDAQALSTLLGELSGGDVERRWLAAEELGNYPKALDALLAALPRADGDQTLFLCKALAQIKDKKAVGPLLKKWQGVPRGAPGTRYIPDALAAIGDRRVVPALIAPLKRCRFDFRFHIAHALGSLGGPEAQQALEDLARNDPFPAVREEAKRALAALRPGS
jgi:hypothetical protein